MCWRMWNKLFVVSSAFAVAGTLACTAALLDTLLPRNSLASFLCWSAGVAAAIVLLVNGYVWACDWCEDYLSRQMERRLDGDADDDGPDDSHPDTDREPIYPLARLRGAAARRERRSAAPVSTL